MEARRALIPRGNRNVADEVRTGADEVRTGIEEIQNAEETLAAAATGPTMPATQSKWYRWRNEGTALVAYLLDSEVHTFAFSVAANAILSFIPFVVLLYTLADSMFHRSADMIKVINSMVEYYFPSNQDFVATQLAAVAALSTRHGIQVFSLIMIVVACTGIFLPLEVALNQAWGVTKSRNYIMNQTVAFGLAILMAVLGILSVAVNAFARQVLTFVFFNHVDNFAFKSISTMLLASTTAVATIAFLFSVYWVLPNRKVPWRPVFKTALWTGLIWIGSKFVFEAILPRMDLKSLYGPFYVSVGLLFWSYATGLILFAGAQFSVARNKSRE